MARWRRCVSCLLAQMQPKHQCKALLSTTALMELQMLLPLRQHRSSPQNKLTQRLFLITLSHSCLGSQCPTQSKTIMAWRMSSMTSVAPKVNMPTQQPSVLRCRQSLKVWPSTLSSLKQTENRDKLCISTTFLPRQSLLFSLLQFLPTSSLSTSSNKQLLRAQLSFPPTTSLTSLLPNPITKTYNPLSLL